MSTVKILNPKPNSGSVIVKGKAARFLEKHPMNANQPRPWRIVVDSKRYPVKDNGALVMKRQWEIHIFGGNGEPLLQSKQRYENKKDCVSVAMGLFAGHPATLEIVKPK